MKGSLLNICYTPVIFTITIGRYYHHLYFNREFKLGQCNARTVLVITTSTASHECTALGAFAPQLFKIRKGRNLNKQKNGIVKQWNTMVLINVWSKYLVI